MNGDVLMKLVAINHYWVNVTLMTFEDRGYKQLSTDNWQHLLKMHFPLWHTDWSLAANTI